MAPHESFLQNFAFPLWLSKIKIKLVRYERLQPLSLLMKRKLSPCSRAPGPVLAGIGSVSPPRLACHWCWQVPPWVRQRGGCPTDSISCCFACSQSGCHIQQKETAGKSPNKQRVSHGEFSWAVPRPLPPVYNRDAQIPFPQSPGTQKWTSKSALDSHHSLIHSFIHYLLSPSLMSWILSPAKFIHWCPSSSMTQNVTVFEDIGR